MVERHQPAVDLGPGAGVADLGVHGVGEVDGRGPPGQGDDAALRREDVDLVLVEVDLELVVELLGVRDLLLPVDDAVEPDHGVGLGAGLLVAPVGRHPDLGPAVHLPGADLDLQGLAAGAHDGGVERLVEVELGVGDVVLEPALDRGPGGVDGAQGGVAVLHRVDEHPDAHQVEDVVEGPALHDHLLVDAPVVLRAPGHLGVDAQLLDPVAHLLQHLGQVEVALGRPHRHHVVDLGVALGLLGGEGQVLELLAQVLHAEAVRQRGVDVEGLLGDALLLPRRQGREGAHVVEAVGQLDDDHPQVAGHGHQHLAHGGRLLGLLGLEVEPLDLGDAVDEVADLGAEVALDVGEGHARVLHRVVEQGGGDGDVVEAEAGHDAGHGQGVGDVGLARLAHLAGVGHLGRVVGLGDHGRRALGVAGLEVGQQGLEDLVAGRGLPAPREHASDGRHRPSLPRGRPDPVPRGAVDRVCQARPVHLPAAGAGILSR